MTKMVKIGTLIMSKTAEILTLLGRTYLYSPYKGVPPPWGSYQAVRDFRLRKSKQQRIPELTLKFTNASSVELVSK